MDIRTLIEIVVGIFLAVMFWKFWNDESMACKLYSDLYEEDVELRLKYNALVDLTDKVLDEVQLENIRPEDIPYFRKEFVKILNLTKK